ncbi:MAG: iron ABC transporter substrate-binding protein, partial [Phyllobacteriaceae bacterium]|nr:iron ABC transporter substrate-binding protein [Phyllobacteriaceae bacterium]
TERILADVERVLARVPAASRPRLYLARGMDGFETGSRGSINTEILERAGGINVVEVVRDGGGIVRVSPERVIAWAPDTIVTIDPAVHHAILERPEWRPVPAVARRRVFLAPDTPFGTIDFPPSVNRLIGLPILMHLLYPEQTTTPLREEIRRFHALFYGLDPAPADLDRLLDGLEN